ncbi:trehalose-phosphatase [Croceicoccus bisphenolivorans]|uniref:trehalose-phosphatase n=1 Tax=Croceicoccus bisphenolivorans TaxID=1783232 RepID=UPI001FE05E37|nr:trehalose-phosphatase [Croceicoccus bisphenolivorans]
MTRTMPEPPPLDPSRDALFLDFDGTLVPLAERPEAVHVPDTLIERLHRLADRLDGRLAIVSGRYIADLDGFGLGALPVAGSHGGEWRLADGEHCALPRPKSLDAAREAFVAFSAAREGVIFEDKPLGAALHFRLAPQHADASIALAREHAAGLHLQPGHEMIEVRVPGVHKGTAIARLMDVPPFAGHRPVFLGDDVTDEDGFAAVTSLEGHGVLIGPVRESRAAYRLSDPAAVKAWLAAMLEPAG